GLSVHGAPPSERCDARADRVGRAVAERLDQLVVIEQALQGRAIRAVRDVRILENVGQVPPLAALGDHVADERVLAARPGEPCQRIHVMKARRSLSRGRSLRTGWTTPTLRPS